MQLNLYLITLQLAGTKKTYRIVASSLEDAMKAARDTCTLMDPRGEPYDKPIVAASEATFDQLQKLDRAPCRIDAVALPAGSKRFTTSGTAGS